MAGKTGGPLTENEIDDFDRIKPEMRVKILKYRFMEQNTQDDVGKRLFPGIPSGNWYVSYVQRGYGIEGKKKNLFKNWGILEKVTEDDLRAFVSKYPKPFKSIDNGETMRQFLMQRIAKREKNVQGFQREVPVGRSYAEDDTYEWSNESVYAEPLPYRGIDIFSPLKKVVAFVLIAAVIIFGVRLFSVQANAGAVGKLPKSFGWGYKVEAYKSGGIWYLGSQKSEEPYGVNLSCDRLWHFQSGYYKKGLISGEGVSYDGTTLQIGYRKKNVFTKSWCIAQKQNELILAKYKKGKPTGIGLLRVDGVTKIVNFSKDRKEIAVYNGESWLKPDGKELKLKDGKYKGMVLLSDTEVEANGISFNIGEKKLSYTSKTYQFEGTKEQFKAYYYSKKNTIEMNYFAYNGNPSSMSMLLDGDGFQWELKEQ